MLHKAGSVMHCTCDVVSTGSVTPSPADQRLEWSPLLSGPLTLVGPGPAQAVRPLLGRHSGHQPSLVDSRTSQDTPREGQTSRTIPVQFPFQNSLLRLGRQILGQVLKKGGAKSNLLRVKIKGWGSGEVQLKMQYFKKKNKPHTVTNLTIKVPQKSCNFVV